MIGGIAVQRWGQPRLTRDADVTLFTDFGNEETFVDALLAEFPAREAGAREFALRTRVLFLRHENGIDLDVALGALPFEQRCIERSSLWHAAEGCDLRTCSAEDLVVHKAFAARAQDWLDVDGIIRRQAGKLNTKQIFEELEPLAALKEQPEIVTELRRLLVQYGSAE